MNTYDDLMYESLLGEVVETEEYLTFEEEAMNTRE